MRLLLLPVLPILLTLSGVAAAESSSPPEQQQQPVSVPVQTAPPLLEPGSPFRVRPAVEIPLTVVAFALAAVPDFFKRELPGPACGPLCDASALNALDVTVVGNRSPEARKASDVLLGLGIGLPAALDLIDVLVTRRGDRVSSRFASYGKDVLVLSEVLAANLMLSGIFKFAVRRARPLAYDPEMPLEDRTAADASLSFYSAHSAVAFGMATAYCTLFTLRHPRSRLVVPLWIVLEGAAAATAYLRVHAGMHFWTDILVGAAVGAATGAAIPLLHRLPSPRGSTLQAIPTLGLDGAGISLRLVTR